MEIKDLLKELINAANITLDERGNPCNFNLEDFISSMEGYYIELDEIGKFHFVDDGEQWWEEDGDY